MNRWQTHYDRPSQLWLSLVERCQSRWSLQQRQFVERVIVETALVDLTTVLALNWKTTKYLKTNFAKCESQFRMELTCECHQIDDSLSDDGE